MNKLTVSLSLSQQLPSCHFPSFAFQETFWRSLWGSHCRSQATDWENGELPMIRFTPSLVVWSIDGTWISAGERNARGSIGREAVVDLGYDGLALENGACDNEVFADQDS